MKRSPLAALTLVSLLAVVGAAGCGTRTAGEPGAAGTGHGGTSASPAPTRPTDFPCPGETAAPTTAAPEGQGSSTPAVPPTDHYAENHGFMVPYPLYGQQRCDGLAAVKKITAALELLRLKREFSPGKVHDVLTGLGYDSGKVTTQMNGDTGVAFLVDATPICLKGAMYASETEADSFAGYPDRIGCDRPRGGH